MGFAASNSSIVPSSLTNSKFLISGIHGPDHNICTRPDHTRMYVIASFNLHVLTCALFDHQLAMLALAWVDLQSILTGSNFIASFF